jgi:hypothetical protein
LKLPDEIDGVILIKNWEVIPPFQYDTLIQAPNSSFTNMDLAAYGIDEKNFYLNDLEKLSKNNIDIIWASTGNNYLDYYSFRDINANIRNLSNYYAFTRIYSESEKELILIADGAHSYCIWLNQKLVLEERGKVRNEKVGDRFVRIQLKKGYNDLFAKVSRGGNIYNWKLLVGFADDAYALQLYGNNYYQDFINNSLVTDTLSLYVGHLKPMKIEVLDPKKNSIKNS